jgi:hypothetical protein
MMRRSIQLCLFSWLIISLGTASPCAWEITTQDASPASAQDMRALELGQPLKRELAGGEAHSYRITLSAGQYLRVVVDQRGVDVVVRLFGPDGRQLVESNVSESVLGPEPISIVADVSGEYRLEVGSIEDGSPTGRYKISIEAPREPTPQDNDRIAVEKIFLEATRLRLHATAESLQAAVEKYRESLQLWQAIGDQYWEAETLNSLTAVEKYRESLQLWQVVYSTLADVHVPLKSTESHYNFGKQSVISTGRQKH